MKILTARARKINADGSLGEWVIGQPIEIQNKVFIVNEDCFAWIDEHKELRINGQVEVHHDTLGYETGKLDCNKKMIYGGMKVSNGVWQVEAIVVYAEYLMTWVVEFQNKNKTLEYLNHLNSSDLEIMKEGE